MTPTNKIHDFLINYFTNDNLVNTVTLAKTSEIDHNQNNLYQLINLDLTSSQVNEQTINYTFIITSLQQRDKPNVNYDSKLLSDTNYLSNMNETHFVLNRFLNIMQDQLNENIEVLNVSELRTLRNFNRQDLDGWQTTIVFQLVNDIPSC